MRKEQTDSDAHFTCNGLIWNAEFAVLAEIRHCVCNMSRPRSNHADAQDDLGLRWYHIPSDQTMLMHRMIWVYAGIICHQIKPCWCTRWSGSTLVSYTIRSNHADAQDDLGLRWYHMPSDQTMLMHKMIWVYAGIIYHQIKPCWCTRWSGSTLVSYAVRSNHADAQDDLGLRWYHIPSDQTMLMHRMIWVYAGIICHQIKPCWCTRWSGSTLVSYTIRSNHADAQDDLGLRWYHMPSDQTMLMHKMIWVYAGIICHQIVFICWYIGPVRNKPDQPAHSRSLIKMEVRPISVYVSLCILSAITVCNEFIYKVQADHDGLDFHILNTVDFLTVWMQAIFKYQKTMFRSNGISFVWTSSNGPE